MKEKYPKPVELEDGTYTFQNEDGSLWLERFKGAWPFSEDLAAVKLEDGWTFVDKNHNFWSERFEEAWVFSEGLSPVKLEDGWTFVEKGHNVWSERFRGAFCFRRGFARVDLFDWSTKYVDKEHRIYSMEETMLLELIYCNPKQFLEMPTEKFKDVNFIQGAIFQVKNALIDPIQGQEKVDAEYEKTCLELLKKCKEKTHREREIIEQRQDTEKVIKSIKEFNL